MRPPFENSPIHSSSASVELFSPRTITQVCSPVSSLCVWRTYKGTYPALFQNLTLKVSAILRMMIEESNTEGVVASDHTKPQGNPKIQVSFPTIAGAVAALLPESALWDDPFEDPFPTDVLFAKLFFHNCRTHWVYGRDIRIGRFCSRSFIQIEIFSAVKGIECFQRSRSVPHLIRQLN